MEYFISINGKTLGPMTLQQVVSYPVNTTTMVCTAENHDWKPLFNYPELMELISGRTNPYYTSHGIYVKDRVVAGVLAILLGGLGAQYFYLGKIGAAFLTILLSLVSCGIWPLLMFAQGIYMLTLTQEQFDIKYTYSTAFYPIF